MSDAQPTEAIPQNKPPQKPQKPGKTLPTTRISFAKQIEILRAFGAAYMSNSKPVSSAEIGKLIDMAPSTVPLAYPFFVDVGLLQRGEGGYIPNVDVVAFHRARQWNAEEAEQKLRPSLKDTWFAQALTKRLAFRGSLEESEAIAVLAEAANAAPEYRSQLSLLISYLETAGIITKDGTTIGAVLVREPQGPAPLDVPKPTAHVTVAAPTQTPAAARTTEQHLLDILDPDEMDDAEQNAVWTLLKYLKKKARASATSSG